MAEQFKERAELGSALRGPMWGVGANHLGWVGKIFFFPSINEDTEVQATPGQTFLALTLIHADFPTSVPFHSPEHLLQQITLVPCMGHRPHRFTPT